MRCKAGGPGASQASIAWFIAFKARAINNNWISLNAAIATSEREAIWCRNNGLLRRASRVETTLKAQCPRAARSHSQIPMLQIGLGDQLL